MYSKEKSITELADWVIHKSHIPYLILPLTNVPYSQILAEAQSLDDLYVEHRSNDSQGWASLCVHGISSQHTDHYAVYPTYQNLDNEHVPYCWTEIQDRCPTTVEYFKNTFPLDVYHRVRYMRLAPGGYIKPHSDSTDLGLRAINFSLNNPTECDFLFKDYGLVPFSNSGSAIMLANGYIHSVENRSTEYRYHLIVHGYATHKRHEYNQLIVNGYKSLVPKIL